MPFGFGGSKTSTDSQSSSYDRSQSGSVSAGFGTSQSEQNIAFEDVFARLFGGAEGAAAGLDPSMLTSAANTLYSSGTGFMDRIGTDAGSRYLEDRLAGDSGLVDEQIGLLGEDLGKFFNEQLLPGITSEAVGGGTLGGGRQGVAQGRAVDAVGEQFRRGASDIRTQDLAMRDQAAATLGDQNIQGIMAGLSGLPALAGIADMGFGAGISPYERLAVILGGPTALTSASSQSGDFASAYSQSYGESQATSRSRGASFNFSPFG